MSLIVNWIKQIFYSCVYIEYDKETLEGYTKNKSCIPDCLCEMCYPCFFNESEIKSKPVLTDEIELPNTVWSD
jgi:hypothetical protein